MSGGSDDAQVFSVSELTREIRALLEGHWSDLWVEGEVSNLRVQSSGHQYFTLKDAGAQISCVLFRAAASRNALRLAEGMQVKLQGELSVYEPRGQYQLIVRLLQDCGVGALQARFEALKRRLHAEGLFDSHRKRALPRIPQVVALVTSPTAAALQDMLNVLTRRSPWLHLLLYPVRVQGQGAAAESVAALRALNHATEHGWPRPEVIVLARGGGSIEDLWSYNDEGLARAIAGSDIPVISAVGHEIDFTIADFAADLRAPTPSAAAELLAEDAAQMRQFWDQCEGRLRLRLNEVISRHERSLEALGKGALLHGLRHAVQRAEMDADALEQRLSESAQTVLQRAAEALLHCERVLAVRHPRSLLLEAGHRVESLGIGMAQTLSRSLERREAALSSRAALLRSLGPEAVLSRGYSMTLGEDGQPLRDAAALQEGQVITTRLQRGELRSRVEGRSAAG